MSNEWENYELNSKIVNNLVEELKFDAPTEIQKRVLNYLNSKVDLLIQAKTGEGKTLCYALPIVNYILNFYERAEEKIKKISPVALILVPTRELGIQVNSHISAILRDLSTDKKNFHNIKIANVLGGFAKPKQIRILNKYNPEIIIATPGRMWEIMENDESLLMSKFYKLRFLVLDEADRMTEKGHFKELKNIIDYVYTKLDSTDLKVIKEDTEGNENSFSFKKKVDRLIKGTTQLADKEENKKLHKALKEKGFKININDIETIEPMQMFENEEHLIDNFNFEGMNDEEEQLEEEEFPEEGEDSAGEAKEVMEEEEINNEEEEYVEEENFLDQNKLKRLKNSEDKIQREVTPKHQIHLRTILCSATIEQVHKNTPKKNKRRRQQKEEEKEEKVNLENLVKNVRFYNKLIYVRNKTSSDENEIDGNSMNIDDENKKSNLLPEKLELDCFKCESSIKDYYLLHILKENEGKSIIVFTNSISHTKKIYSIFSFFDFKLTVLHSKMQQSQRIKNLDRFRRKEVNVLFCTDVGARGLDVSMVDLVIHYHIPKTTELFIHRSGRTARASKEGTSISLISEAELSIYKKIMKDLKIKEFGMKTLNVMQLEKYKSLFEYTKKIEKEDHSIKKKNREKQWFEKRATECEMILDEDNVNQDEEEEKKQETFLNKKRKLQQKDKIKDKKVFNNIITQNIKRSSFLTSDMVSKLNSLINNPTMKDINITQAIYNANVDAESFRYKGKQRKKRYLRRRK